METIIFENTLEIRKNLKELQDKLKVKISLQGRKVTLEGEPVDEYEANIILGAINFGFSAKKALVLLEPEMIFKTLNIKDSTKRKKLEDVRGRIIGKEGQVKRTIEDISDCLTELRGNTIGIIGSADNINNVITALKNLVRGSKQANVYRYLEEMNTYRKDQDDDLGLKAPGELTKFEKKKLEAEKRIAKEEREARKEE